MSEPAAILATFSDFAIVRSRKVARLIFEVPIEQAKQALDTLGMPDPAGEVWCGIAKTNLKVSGPKPQLDTGPGKEGGGSRGSASGPPPSKPNSTRAVMMAKDPEFQKYCGATDATSAEREIKVFCGVASKAELNDEDGKAAKLFRGLRDDFRAWRERQRREDYGKWQASQDALP